MWQSGLVPGSSSNVPALTTMKSGQRSSRPPRLEPHVPQNTPCAGPPRHSVYAKRVLTAQPAETARRHEPVRHERRPAMLPAPGAVAMVHGCECTLGLVSDLPAQTASGHRMRPPRVLRHGAPSRAKASQGPLQEKLTASAGFTLMMWSGCTRSANVAL